MADDSNHQRKPDFRTAVEDLKALAKVLGREKLSLRSPAFLFAIGVVVTLVLTAVIAQPPVGAGVISALVAAAGVIFAAFVTLRKDREIATLRVTQDLQIEYDKDLRSRRIVQYQKLWSCMLTLAKYPEADPPAYDSIKKLSESLRDWYFEEGGLILSEKTRVSYFNLQDGLKIVMQKREERWPLEPTNINSTEDHDRLRRHLERPKDWKAPPKLVDIANSRLDMSKKVVPKEVHVNLRLLGSSLRTSTTEDVLTRKGTYLEEVQQVSVDMTPIA